MNTIKARNRILSLALALCLLLGMVVYLPGPVMVRAALPPYGDDAEGEPWDGINFEALEGSGIYYGIYNHATSFQNTYYGTATIDTNAAPVLWQVMGEEENSKNLTLLSEYVLDSAVFNPTSNYNHIYEGSSIMTTLNAMSSDIFQSVESTYVETTTVKTRMHDWNTGAELINTQHGANYPADSTGQTLYLPWGKYGEYMLYWDAGADDTDYDYNLSTPTARLRGGSTDVYYWLRSPYSALSTGALYVDDYGGVSTGAVSRTHGVRPAFQLNTESVIFTSEILDDVTGKPWATQADGTDYVAAAGGDAPNFKLTIVDGGINIGTVTAGGETVNASIHPLITADPGDSFQITAGGATSGTKLTYKIVSRASGQIVGWGQTTNVNETDLTVTAKDLDGVDLADGTYTVYVWAQQDNATHSHEGSEPLWFPLVIDNTPPRVSSVFPSGNSVSLGTSGLSVTFDEDMDTNMPTTGTVTINNNATLTNEAWQDNRTITYELDGLQYSTSYTVNISGFKDLAGNVMDSHTHSFTTVDAPQPGQHTVTVRPDPAGGGSPSATPNPAAEDDPVTLTANPNEGWEFTHWSSDSPGVVFDDDDKETTTFDMPDEDVLITAHYTEIDDGNGDNGNGDNGNGDNGNGDNGNGDNGNGDNGNGDNGNGDGDNGNGSGDNGNGDNGNGDNGNSDNGNGDNGNGGSSNSDSRGSSRSGGSSTPDRQVAKTQLPASAFSWDGRTLTINHDNITPLGLLSVRWDGGADLTRGTDYSVYQGSVIVRFSEAFMAAQSPGEHTIKVEFMNHTGETTVTVGDTGLTTGEPNDDLFSNDTHNPNTGGYPDGVYPEATDNPNTGNNRGIWPALLLCSLGGLALVLYKGKRKLQ